MGARSCSTPPDARVPLRAECLGSQQTARLDDQYLKRRSNSSIIEAHHTSISRRKGENKFSNVFSEPDPRRACSHLPAKASDDVEELDSPHNAGFDGAA